MKKYTNATKFYLHLMKIGGLHLVLILFILNVGYASTCIAQNILDYEINTETKNQQLKDLLLDLEKTYDIQFTYSIQKVDVNQVVSISKQNKTIKDLLNEILLPLDISYLVFNNRNIVLSRKRNKFRRKSGIILTGSVYNEEAEPVQFANVVLARSNGSSPFLKGAVTDELGKFEMVQIEPGSYNLSVTYIGYKSIDTTLNIEKSTNLGAFIMMDDLNTLDGVSISARRKLIRQEIDRLVVNVENSMLANRGNVLEVLASTPGVSVRNDEINMIGKSAVGIMIDDKLIDLTQDELANYLRSISSDDVMSIEVISNPSSKFEAQGNSGLINIVLKKARKNSWNASIRAGYRKRTNDTNNLGANFSYNKNKLSIASSLFIVDGKYYQEQDDYAYFPDALWYTSSPLLSDFRRMNARLDLSYQLTDRWSIGGQYMRNSTDYLITDNPYTPVYDYETNEIKRYLFSSFSQMNWKPRFNSVNLNSSITMDSSRRKVHFNLDYFKYQNEDIRQYRGESVISNPSSEQYYAGYNANLQDVENVSGAVDFDHPLDWASLEYGMKITSSTSENDISLFNSGLVDEDVNEMPLADNDFSYTENVQAAYLSLSKPFSSKLNAQVGLRIEATQTKSYSENLNLDESNDYIKGFPTLYLNYTHSDKLMFGLNYGRRISRPGFGQLNPNVFFINPFQTIVGNAFLQPSFTDNFELVTTYENLTSKFYYSDEQNIFSQVPLPNSANNVITFLFENYVNTKRFGISEFFVFDHYSWWSSSNSFDLNYSVSSFNLPTEHEDLRGYSSSFSTSNDFSILGVEGLSANISFWYAFKGLNYIFNTGRASNMSGSIQYLMLDKKLKISLAFNDVFKDSAERLEATVNEVFQTARYYYDARSIGLNISYSFGNRNISAKKHQTGNAEERSRTGN